MIEAPVTRQHLPELHFVDWRRSFVYITTDSVTSHAIMHALRDSDSRLEAISSDELPLYRNGFFRFVVMADPLRRLARAWELMQVEEPDTAKVMDFEDFLSDVVLRPSNKGQWVPQSRESTYFSLVLPQWCYFKVNEVYEVDALFRLELSDVWFPMLRKRFALSECAVEFKTPEPDFREVSKPVLLKITNAYAEDYRILKDLGERAFVAL